MDMSDRYTVIGRRPHMVNTDPQRRCYNGCNFSEELQWGAWVELGHPHTIEKAKEDVDFWKQVNPTHEYKFLNPGEKP